MEVPQTKTANSNSVTNKKASSITSINNINKKPQQKNDRSSTSYANVSQRESTGSELSKQVQQSERSVTQIETNKANSNIDNTNFEEDRESPDTEKETTDFVRVQRQKIKRIYIRG
ncbi:Hypothetical predicted protein, partial [Paramuricea clavata]